MLSSSPTAHYNFSEGDGITNYRDAKDYAECLIIQGVWLGGCGARLTDTASTADTISAEHAFTGSETRIHLPAALLTLSQLTAMLNTIPWRLPS